MPSIDVVYEGDLGTRATHQPSGAVLRTDAPKDNEGRGEGFSPTDLVGTALGTCMLTVMGIVARRRGISMDGASARVEKHMVADPDRRVGRLEVTIRLPAALDGEERRTLERAAMGCPVARSLRPEVEVVVAFR